MFQNILLAFDGSEHSRRAAEYAGQCARQSAMAIIRVVVVVEPIRADLGEPNFTREASERTLAGQKLLEAAKQVVGAGPDIHTELLFGSAAEEIVQVAEVRRCDLIVMGTRGLSPMAGVLMGSQAQKVISRAPCPVLVVR